MEKLEGLTGPQLIAEIKSLLSDPDADPDDTDDAVEWFCYKYNPKTKIKALHTDGKAMTDESFISLILEKAATKYFPEIYFEIFSILATVRGAEQLVAAGHQIPTACMLMAKDDKNAKTQRSACRGLAKLTEQNPDIRNYMAKTRIFLRLIETLKTSTTESLKMDALNAITNSLYKSKVAKKTFILHKGVESVLDCLSKTKSQLLITQCLIALRNIVGSASLQELQQHLITHEIMKYISSDEPKLVIHSLWIAVLMSARHDDVKDYLIEHGIIRTLLDCISVHKTSKEVQEPGAAALGILSKRHLARNDMATHRGIHVVLAVMCRHKEDKKLMESYKTLLKRLMCHKEIRDSFGINRLPTGRLDLKKFDDAIDDALIATEAKSKLRSNRASQATSRPQSGQSAAPVESGGKPDWMKKLASPAGGADSVKKGSTVAGLAFKNLPDPVTQPVRAQSTPRSGTSVEAVSKPAPAGAPLPEMAYADILAQKETLDKARLHEYLSDAEFSTIFKMDKEAFRKLPAWRQATEKKKVQLF